MQLFRSVKTTVNTLALLLVPFWLVPADAQASEEKTKQDNTAVNKRDQSPGAATADQQKMNATDRNLSARNTSKTLLWVWYRPRVFRQLLGLRI